MKSVSEPILLGRAEKVIEKRIRPYLKSHGGDIVLEGIEDGVLCFELTGCCSGCSSAWLTAEELIRPAILEEVPELKNVAVKNDLDEESIQIIHDVLSGKLKIG